MPLSTLHVPPRDDPRMTRGQDGSLFLSCKTLSFSIPCRFIPAHLTSICGSIRFCLSAARCRNLPQTLSSFPNAGVPETLDALWESLAPHAGRAAMWLKRRPRWSRQPGNKHLRRASARGVERRVLSKAVLPTTTARICALEMAMLSLCSSAVTAPPATCRCSRYG